MAGFLRKQDEVLHYFLRYPQYLLFRWNVNSYGVLVKGELSRLPELTDNCVEVCEADLRKGKSMMDWYVSCRKTSGEIELAFPVLSECESIILHIVFMVPGLHVS